MVMPTELEDIDLKRVEWKLYLCKFIRARVHYCLDGRVRAGEWPTILAEWNEAHTPFMQMSLGEMQAEWRLAVRDRDVIFNIHVEAVLEYCKGPDISILPRRERWGAAINAYEGFLEQQAKEPGGR